MKIIFFGTPDFAVPSLQKIFESKHQVAAVVTAPDKQRGRGRKVSFTAVKQYADENNLRVLQPTDFSNAEFVNQLKSFNADLFVIVAFRILPEKVFTIPPKGSFNLHGSLLPKYRGAAPIQWALINGDKETGVTTFFLKKKVDTGNLILQKRIEIEPSDNLGTLHDKMSITGADLVLETIDLIDNGEVKEILQDNSLACPAPKINKEICRINWREKSANEIHNLIRGISPFPGAFFEHGNKIYKVYKSQISTEMQLAPEEIKQTKKQLFIGTKTGTLEILEIQPSGRKRMKTEEFLRGYSLL